MATKQVNRSSHAGGELHTVKLEAHHRLVDAKLG